MFDSFNNVDEKINDYCMKNNCPCKFEKICDAIEEIIENEIYPFRYESYFGYGGYL